MSTARPISETFAQAVASSVVPVESLTTPPGLNDNKLSQRPVSEFIPSADQKFTSPEGNFHIVFINHFARFCS